MKDGSDNRERRISATEASRSFSRILDEIEAGRRFLIHRRGENVCLMTPPVGVARQASECLAYLRTRSPVVLDERFGDDLLDILTGEPVADTPPWDS